MTKQEIEKKLTKRLFWNIVKTEGLDREKLSVSIDNSKIASSCYSYSTGYSKISISITGAKYRARNGYQLDDYYQGRKELLNKYILHNLHNQIRFVIYHELKHSIDNSKNMNYSEWPQRRAEYQADCYALKHLKHSRRADWNA